MFHSKILEFKELESLIFSKERELLALKELKKRRLGELNKVMLDGKTHFGTTFKTAKGKITEVTCNCGKITRYKSPLNLIDDFKCPEDKPDDTRKSGSKADRRVKVLGHPVQAP